MILTLTMILAIAPQTSNPNAANVREAYQELRKNILQSAEKMPAEEYGFRPAPRVRTFGQILGHVAQEQYLFFCGPVKGEQKSVDVEKTKTTKPELLAALKESFAYCDSAYDGMTDAALTAHPEHLRLLWMNVLHDGEHYGNLVTYLRIKGIVPPSTEGN